MWLQGKENFLITMDSHGRIVCHDLLNQPFSHTLTSSLERGRKCFFLKKFFFLAVIQGNETFLNFFTIPIKNMQKQNFARTVVLQNINVTIWDIQEIDSKTGYVIDLKILSDLINENIIERFDHKNLNLDTVEFKDLNPTAENIAIVIYNILREKLDKQYELKVVLYETERNYVEYPA